MPSNHVGRNGSGENGRRPAVVAFPEDRLPPQNLDLERSVLGAILLDNDALHEVVMVLKVEDFYRDSHQIIYRCVRELYDAGKPVDLLILSEELRRKGEFDKIGGLETLSEISTSAPHSANAKYHAQIVREKAVARELIEAANTIHREAYSNTHTAEDLLEIAERKVFEIAEDQASGDTVELRDIVTQAMDRIVLRSESRHPVTGIGTGFYELDDLTSGFQGSQLIIIAARPSMGKTAFALNICEHVTCTLRKSVLFVSLEMGELELAERLLSSRARVDSGKLRTGKGLGHRELQLLGKGYEDLRSAAPLFIDDTPARNMLQITANARRLKMRNEIGLIVIDYIQLIDSESTEERANRQEQISKISRRLKTLAREMDVPVIALSQLNRSVESREDKKPRMSDLRESGAIEQDADLILMLHRPDYYDPNDSPGIAEVLVVKNRAGATGDVRLTFLKNFTRFENNASIDDSTIDGGNF